MIELVGNFLFLEQGLDTAMIIGIVFVACAVIAFLFFVLPPSVEQYKGNFLIVAAALFASLAILIPAWTAPFDKLAESIENEPNETLKKCILKDTLNKIENQNTYRLSYEQFSYIRVVCRHAQKTTTKEQAEKFKAFAKSQLNEVKTRTLSQGH